MAAAFPGPNRPVTIRIANTRSRCDLQGIPPKEETVADTKKIEDKLERKKVKRAARKKAAPKAKRTAARGANKKKIKKMVRGQSKR